MKIIKAKDYDDMSRKAASIISSQVILFPKSVLGLATGSSPLGIYRQLIDWYHKGDLDFSNITSVNLDEYFGMEENNPQSYHYYMEHNFFSQVNIKKENTFVPDGVAKNIEDECACYDERIMKMGGIDLQLLGLGKTGHIGFNEPGDSFTKETHKVALEKKTIADNSRFFSSADEVPKYAVTMGMKSIMQAKRILLVVSGTGKAEVLEKVLFGQVTSKITGSILQLHPNVTVVADSDALKVVMEKHNIEG